MTIPLIDESRIAEVAFHMWLEEGRPDGKAEDHWHRARTALETMDQPQGATAPAAELPPDAVTVPTPTKKPRAAAKPRKTKVE